MIYELRRLGFNVKSQVGIPVNYDVILEIGFRADIIVEDTVILEIKSMEALHDVHKKQLLTYLKPSGMKLGLLVNFNVNSLVDKQSLAGIIN
jgi:GxxExxY protein